MVHTKDNYDWGVCDYLNKKIDELEKITYQQADIITELKEERDTYCDEAYELKQMLKELYLHNEMLQEDNALLRDSWCNNTICGRRTT